MKVCLNCGFRDNPLWRGSRFDFNADYMRFDEAMSQKELMQICDFLQDKGTFVPFELGPYIYYRRGTGGVYLYRVLKEDFKVPRERKKHIASLNPSQSKLFKKEPDSNFTVNRARAVAKLRVQGMPKG